MPPPAAVSWLGMSSVLIPFSMGSSRPFSAAILTHCVASPRYFAAIAYKLPFSISTVRIVMILPPPDSCRPGGCILALSSACRGCGLNSRPDPIVRPAGRPALPRGEHSTGWLPLLRAYSLPIDQPFERLQWRPDSPKNEAEWLEASQLRFPVRTDRNRQAWLSLSPLPCHLPGRSAGPTDRAMPAALRPK